MARPGLEILGCRKAGLLMPRLARRLGVVEQVEGIALLHQRRLVEPAALPVGAVLGAQDHRAALPVHEVVAPREADHRRAFLVTRIGIGVPRRDIAPADLDQPRRRLQRSEEHTSELQSLMRISYAVFSLK